MCPTDRIVIKSIFSQLQIRLLAGINEFKKKVSMGMRIMRVSLNRNKYINILKIGRK